MPASQFGIDVGQIIGQRNALMAAQQQQQMNAFTIQQGQRTQNYQNAFANVGGDLQSADPAKAAAAQGQLFQLDPEKTLNLVKGLDDEKRKTLAEHTDLAGRAAVGLLAVPDEQLIPASTAAAASLKSQGLDTRLIERAIATGDPNAVRAQWKLSQANALTVQQALAEQDRTAARDAAAATAAEAKRHNQATEGQAAAALGETKTHNRATEAAANPFGATGPGAAQPGLTGDAFLATLPPGLAGQVKMLAEGKLAIPSGFALSKPYWQQLLQAANKYDPSIDQASAPARFKTRAAFSAGGTESKTINNLNTAIGHAGTLLDQIGGTYSGPSPMLNAVGNFISTQSGSAGVPLFKDTAGKLAQELTAVYRGSGGAEKDVVRGLESLDVNASDAQKRAVLKNAVTLLDSKMDSLGDQYNRGMGTTKDPLTLLNPHAAETLIKLRGGSGAQSRQGAPAQINSDADYARLPSGARYTAPDGSIRTKR